LNRSYFHTPLVISQLPSNKLLPEGKKNRGTKSRKKSMAAGRFKCGFFPISIWVFSHKKCQNLFRKPAFRLLVPVKPREGQPIRFLGKIFQPARRLRKSKDGKRGGKEKGLI
jgi:hypothetical protein